MVRPVLFVHPSAELYGSDRMFLESVRALTEAGRVVLVVLPTGGPLVRRLHAAGARVLRCRTPVLRKSALRPRGLLTVLRDCLLGVLPALRLLLRYRPETVYVNTVTVPLWPPLARLLGHRVVAHVHEAEQDAPSPVRLGLNAPLLCCHTVLVNSHAAKEVLSGSLPVLREERVRVLRNGVRGPQRTPEPPPPERRPRRLLVVGRLSPRKGTDVAVRAVALLHARGYRVSLDLVGSTFPGYEWFERELEELVHRHGLEHVVTTHGFTDDVWAHYAAADIALVPSRTEPFGNTAVEAQLAMRPVIVTDAQGLPETVDRGRRGHVVPADDPRALADRTAELLDDWETATSLARSARAEAAELFSPRRYRHRVRRVVGVDEGTREFP
ncbi:glycosyltransferase [Actinopolyspora mortivallis]|uniref:Glycosyl transferase family 1 n=1 Tax=Actinopolyspora mortivallis TaxID=33906 RepID=A0A2T0GTZ9_ACTMO|nr:glycosyltransferase [Actinopolyspora mortivallis]PRW62564.1 glycosyl transferase family 1 [Actinopolyspora mortivallis]